MDEMEEYIKSRNDPRQMSIKDPATSEVSSTDLLSAFRSEALEHIRKLIVWGETLADEVDDDLKARINRKTLNDARIFYRENLNTANAEVKNEP